jgi:hypothetical protein
MLSLHLIVPDCRYLGEHRWRRRASDLEPDHRRPDVLDEYVYDRADDLQTGPAVGLIGDLAYISKATLAALLS